MSMHSMRGINGPPDDRLVLDLAAHTSEDTGDGVVRPDMNRGGYLRLAPVGAPQRTSGEEGTSRRDGEDVRHLARDGVQRRAAFGLERDAGPDQGAGVRVLRVVQDLLHRALLDDPA